jgi:hypothetical protein
MDLDRFADDAPEDDAPGDARVCVVATQPDTFQRCRDGVYPSPRHYDRATEPFEYMSFYRTAPISAVTHYAHVTDRVDQRRGEAGPLSDDDWAATIDPFAETDRVVVFELGELVALDGPVENDRTGVRGAWYCTVADLRGARTLSDLATASETN